MRAWGSTFTSSSSLTCYRTRLAVLVELMQFGSSSLFILVDYGLILPFSFIPRRLQSDICSFHWRVKASPAHQEPVATEERAVTSSNKDIGCCFPSLRILCHVLVQPMPLLEVSFCQIYILSNYIFWNNVIQEHWWSEAEPVPAWNPDWSQIILWGRWEVSLASSMAAMTPASSLLSSPGGQTGLQGTLYENILQKLFFCLWV